MRQRPLAGHPRTGFRWWVRGVIGIEEVTFLGVNGRPDKEVRIPQLSSPALFPRRKLNLGEGGGQKCQLHIYLGK